MVAARPPGRPVEINRAIAAPQPPRPAPQPVEVRSDAPDDLLAIVQPLAHSRGEATFTDAPRSRART